MTTPDTTALVAELRAESEYVRLRSAGNGETVTMLDRAADALEAQASRITELEQFLIRMGLRPDHLVP